MAKRRRPRKHGKKPAWMLHRITIALMGYDQARRAGEKHSAALAEGVKAVRERLPGKPMSKSEMRRILAHYRRNRKGTVMLPQPERVVKRDEAKRYLRIIEQLARMNAERAGIPYKPGPRPKRVTAIGVAFGPHPNHPRINAKPPEEPRNRLRRR
jgi:hypothetical protein